MKTLFTYTTLALMAALLLFSSCNKSKECQFKSKYIYEPLVYGEDCNCIVQGKVKYLKNCETVLLVDYGNGECDNIATKTICIDGKCEEESGANTQTFTINCNRVFEEGPISDEEAAELGI